MKYLSDRMTSASGSIGGTTFSHARGTLYTRARRIPVNPRTVFQTAVRAALAGLQSQFPTLTALQRTGWQTLADTMVFKNSLGSDFKMTAQQIYVSANAAFVQAGNTASPDRPDSATRCPLNAAGVSIAITSGGTSAAITFDPTDAWANDVNGLLLIYASPPQNPTKNFYAGPYRLAGSIAGAAIPLVPPISVSIPFASGVPTGSKQFFRVLALLPPTYFPSSSVRVAATV